jgi:hypothetical protein
MSFVVQPTDTFINELFVPTIEVQISDGQADSLTIFSPSCDIAPLTVTANSTGLAVFMGLMTGPTDAISCNLIVHNNTRPSVPDITSVSFQILTALVPSWQFLGSTIAGSTDSTAISVALNTTNANVLVVCQAQFDASFAISDNAGNNWSGGGPAYIVFNQLTTSDGNFYQVRMSIGVNFNTAATHVFTAAAAGSFPVLGVMAFRATNPVIQANSTNEAFNLDSLAISPGLSVSPGFLVPTLFATDPNNQTNPVIFPAGYSGTVMTNSTNSVGLAMAYRIFTLATIETPLWAWIRNASGPNYPLIVQAASISADLL